VGGGGGGSEKTLVIRAYLSRVSIRFSFYSVLPSIITVDIDGMKTEITRIRLMDLFGVGCGEGGVKVVVVVVVVVCDDGGGRWRRGGGGDGDGRGRKGRKMK